MFQCSGRGRSGSEEGEDERDEGRLTEDEVLELVGMERWVRGGGFVGCGFLEGHAILLYRCKRTHIFKKEETNFI